MQKKDYQHDAHYLLVIFIPTTHLDTVKEALFNEKAGCIGNYERCAWQTLGQGSFRPMVGSQPHVGQIAADTTVDEWRVEMVCLGQYMSAIVDALILAHPYETPAYFVMPVL